MVVPPPILNALISDIQSASLDTMKAVYTLLTEAKVGSFDGDGGILFVLDAISETLAEQLAAVVDANEFEPA